MIEHHALFYEDLRDPIALLRGAHAQTRLEQFWAYATAGAPSDLDSDATRDYTALMSSSQPLIARNVLQAYPFRRHQHLLDVGGGDGTFALNVANDVEHLHVTLFDLPAVAVQARARFETLGLSSRLKVVAGDFRVDPLPRGADVISLVRVLHDHDDSVVQRILAAAADALPVGGTLVIAEPMSGVDSGATVADAYFGFYLLAMGSGRARSPSEFAQLLDQAGFGPPKQVSTHMPGLVRVLVARKIV